MRFLMDQRCSGEGMGPPLDMNNGLGVSRGEIAKKPACHVDLSRSRKSADDSADGSSLWQAMMRLYTPGTPTLFCSRIHRRRSSRSHVNTP